MFSMLGLLPVLLAQTSAGFPNKKACEFGIAQPWSVASCSFVLTNDSKVDWLLRLPRSPISKGTGNPRVLLIQPGSSSQIEMPVQIEGRLGRVSVTETLKIKEDGRSAQDLRVIAKGFVYSPLNQADLQVDLGAVDSHQRLESSKTLTLASDDVPGLSIDKVVSTPDFVSATMLDTNTLKISLSEQANWGLNSGYVVVRLNTPEQKTAKILVTANVLGRVRPGENPVPIGVVRRGPKQGFQVRLTSLDKQPLRIGDVRFDMGLHAHAKIGPCLQESSECRLVHVSIDPSQGTGNISSRMVIELPAYKKSLTVGVAAVLLDPDYKVQNLEKLVDQKSRQAQSQANTAAPDLGSALKRATRPPVLPPADPPGKGPVLRWSVANEQTLYGYLIYRAEHENGPWQRVNERIIPVLGHDDAPSDYAWRDISAVKGKTYWYFIKTLANNGSKQKLTEAHKVVAH